MSRSSNIWFAIALAMICSTAIASTIAVYYYMSYTSMEKLYTETLTSLDSLTYNVNILIKYGNKKVWYNQTRIPIGWSLLQATNKTTGGRVLGQTYSFGTFVTEINSVRGTGPEYWIAYTWNGTKWTSLEVSPEHYILRQGETVAWYLTDDWSKTP